MRPGFVHAPPGLETIPPDFEPGHIQVFDSGADNAAITGKHGKLGPTHCARFEIPDYEYQIELYLETVAEDYPDARRALAPDGREWTREPGKPWGRAR